MVVALLTVSFAGDYGYIPQTSGEDGDPRAFLIPSGFNLTHAVVVDIVIISNYTLLPNTMCVCRVVGMMQMTDEKGHDAKIMAVVESDPRSAEIKARAPSCCFSFAACFHLCSLLCSCNHGSSCLVVLRIRVF